MRHATLAEWLAWQERAHPKLIDPGLERVGRVARAMGLLSPSFPVITVGGTNGKGSTTALLEAMLQAGGYRSGVYRSPHVLRYNERVRLNGREAADAELMAAFDAIDRARGTTSLSYFEFGTLAAMWLCREAAVDVAVLEVGLGGRLDAVNLWDADCALVTNIGIDHTEWLGPDRDAIGREKAGIFRPGRPALVGEAEPPAGLLAEAAARGAEPLRPGRDFGARRRAATWDWWRAGSPAVEWAGLPLPALPGPHQLGNAALALAALDRLAGRLPLSRAAIELGLRKARLPGRFQVLSAPEPGVQAVFDVAHNPHAAAALAEALAAVPVRGRTLAVLAMLEDKDVAGFAAGLRGQVDLWFPAGLSAPRGLAAAALQARLPAGLHLAGGSADVAAALGSARAAARVGDRILVTGSFLTVEAGLAAWPAAGPQVAAVASAGQ